MPDIIYTALEEGDTFNADSLNSRFTSVREALNAVSPDAVGEGAFNQHHLPSSDISGGQTKSITINPVASGAAACQYKEAHAYYVAGGTNGFVTLDSNGATGGGTEVSLSFAPYLDLSDTGARGILALSNTLVQQLGLDVAKRFMAIFRLSVQDSSGTWYPVHRTERFVQSGYDFNSQVASGDLRPQMLDVPIRALIKKTDLGGDTQLRGIRLRVCVYDPGGELSAANSAVNILNSHLSVVPLRSARP